MALVSPADGNSGSANGITFEVSDTGITWYAANAAAQGNESGKQYAYKIIG